MIAPADLLALPWRAAEDLYRARFVAAVAEGDEDLALESLQSAFLADRLASLQEAAA
jgi:hypothetical protein